MKTKLITFFFTFIVVLPCFAETSKYIELFNQGQKYETEKRWVHALGAYYDALEENQTDEAYDSYKRIARAIESGQPGLGEFDDFSYYEDWISLMAEYENYWYEYCPFIFRFIGIQQKKIYLENKTADYTVKIIPQETKKYIEIHNTIEIGYKSAQLTSKIKNWPNISLSNNPELTAQVKSSLAPTVILSIKQYSYGSYFKLNAATALFEKDDTEGHFPIGSDNYIDLDIAPYEIYFSLIDENGNELKKLGHQVCGYEYIFNVSAEIKNLIDKQKVSFSPTEIHLKYGTIDSENLLSPEWVKKLSDKKISLKNVYWETVYDGWKKVQHYHDSWGELKIRTFGNSVYDDTPPISPNDNRLTIIEKIESNRSISMSVNDSLNWLKKIDDFRGDKKANIIPLSVYNFGCSVDVDYDSYPYIFSIYTVRDYYSDVYSDEKVNAVKNILSLNYYSKKENLQECYCLSSLSEWNKNTESLFEFYLKHFDEIQCNPLANGYRLPTNEEINYLLKKITDNNFKQAIISNRIAVRKK